MARSQNTDHYHAMKFHCKVVTAGISGASDMTVQAGFNTMTMPEATLENVEYKEGTYLYRRKYPGDVTFSDITLTRGTAKKDTAFYEWLRAAYLGEEYRVDMSINHFHRSDVGAEESYLTTQPKRVIKCFEAFPIRVKPGSDFDSLSSDISIQEVDIAIERFELEDTN